MSRDSKDSNAKQKRKSIMDKAADNVTMDDAETVADVYSPDFGTDELGKLQNILIGDHARRVADRIDTLEQALLGAVDDLRAELQERVAEIDSRMTAEADTRVKALSNITSRIDDEGTSNAASLKELTTDLRSTEKDMHAAIDAASSGLSDHVDQLRATTSDLAKADADLNAAKVDRAALARLLSAAVDGLEPEADGDD